MLKNGPLCLAVYGGRDLAGLPSADSHRPVGEEGDSGIRETLLSLIRAVSRARPFTPSSFLPFFSPSSVPRHTFHRGNTFVRGEESPRLRATPHNGRTLADNRGVDIG